MTTPRPNSDTIPTTAVRRASRLQGIEPQGAMTMSESAFLGAGAVRRATARACAVAVLALTATGCSTPMLDSRLALPGRYQADAQAAQGPEEAWWDGYGDPVLADLVQRAGRENRDLGIAAERVRAARAGEAISRSWLMPAVSGVGIVLDQSNRYDYPIDQRLPDTRAAAGGLDVSWEIDLAGGLRAGARAAAADVLAAEHGMRGVRLLVMTDVASNYFLLTGALRQLETLRSIAAAHDETLRLTEARERVGLATPFDVERARSAAASAHAAIPPLETLAAVSRHRIAVLIGAQPGDAAIVVPASAVAATVPASGAGQPAELLQRRPDLLAAKAQLDAANARRRQAQAEWFPRLFVSALFGQTDVDLNSESIGTSRFTNASALLAMPIFNAGRTQAINDIAASTQREALLRYEDAIVRALEDVENALVALDAERNRSESLRIAAGSADAAYGRARSLYDRGQIDLLPLLDAQRAQLAVRVSANDSETALLLDSVRLYKALGGGWQGFESPEAIATATP